MRVRPIAVFMASATLAACTGSSPHRPTTSPVHSAGRQAPQPVAPARPHSVLYLGGVSGGLAFAFVGPTAAGIGRTRLLAVRPDGRHITDIGPAIPHDFYPDSIFFLDRRHGWFTTFWSGGGRETLYRTADGGRTWKTTSVASHSMAGGSTDTLYFTDAQHGWLTNLNPTGPNATLYRTSDAGRTWQRASDKVPGRGRRSLPTVGPVEFGRGREVGWQVTEFDFTPRLYVTRDAGRTWGRAAIPTRQRGLTLPALFGATVVLPVTVCDGSLVRVQMYASTDDGRHWRAGRPTTVATHRRAHRFAPCDRVSSSVPSRDVGWVATIDEGRLVVKRTTDGGGHWIAVATPRTAAPASVSISAVDAHRAWLQVSRGQGALLFATTDGGRTWKRVDPSAAH